MRFIIIAAITCATTSAWAQAAHYDPVEVEAGVVGTYAGASGRGGFGADVEVKFLATDNIGVGAHFEGAVMLGGNIGENGDTKMDVGVVATTLLKGEYLFRMGKIRPFGGLGVGMFDIASQSVTAGPSATGVDQKAGRYFGVAPQVGIDLGMLRLAVTYNIMLGADIEVHQTVGSAMTTSSYSQNYFGFELGFRFGGELKPTPGAY
jgi:outer membrane protein W